VIDQIKRLGFQKDTETKVWMQQTQKDFSYSDGDSIENYLLNSIRACNDKSVGSAELSKFAKDWPTLYHLSSRRSNIIRPFAPYFKRKKVLEVGCGCGALSRYLGEAGADLIAVEGSPRRALIAKERCSDLENVEVVAATSDLVSGLIDFDIVILNGVLEYSPKYMGVNGPSQLLKTSFRQLNKSGILILAIENQLGIKYFAGQPEDHAGKPMYGINNSYRDGEFKTWGKKELDAMLLEVGFNTIEHFIPLPDYKLPVSVITPLGWEKYSTDLLSLAVDSVSEDPQRISADVFSLEKAYEVTWRNGLASDLANSFLIVANKTSQTSNIVSANTLAFQFIENQKDNSRITNEIYLEKSQLMLKTVPINRIVDNDNLPAPRIFIKERSYWFELLQIVNRPNWNLEDVSCWAKVWIDCLKTQTGISGAIGKDTSIDAKYLFFTPLAFYNSKKFNVYLNEIDGIKTEKIKFLSVVYFGLKKSLMKITSLSEIAHNEDLSYFQIIAFVFLNQFSIELDEIQVKKIEQEILKINGMDEVANSNYLPIQQRLNLNEIKIKLNNLQNDFALISNSLSWKITKPLRSIVRLFIKLIK
jgi:O-antigen biosynthesis protein